jgi:cell division protease FtsH
LEDGVDLAVLARGTPGLSGAELANLLNESALMAARRNKKKISMPDIEDAREKVQFGRERRRIMDDEDKKIVAYHEAGHAVVQAILDDGHLPVHKVTIIPRGGSLGSTMFIPKKDILNHGKRRVLNQLAGLMGGRVAEELALGDITSGASGDIKQATKIARHMVCDWGMSVLGPLAFGENQETLFLGREISRSQNYSEETAQKIDSEIHRIVDEQYQRAHKALIEHRAALDTLAAALLEHETLDGVHVMGIIEFGEIRSPLVKPEPPSLPAKAKTKKPKDQQSKPEGHLHGAEPEGAPA